MEGPNLWPTMPGFKDNVARYYSQVLTLARRIVRLFAKVLDLPENYFDSAVRRPGAMLRLLKYPAQDPRDPDALGIGAHTDIEAFTILCQGTQPALQILNVEGQWIQAPPVPGTFVVNIGDMLARYFQSCVSWLMSIADICTDGATTCSSPQYTAFTTPRGKSDTPFHSSLAQRMIPFCVHSLRVFQQMERLDMRISWQAITCGSDYR